jgi:hypothetical protein
LESQSNVPNNENVWWWVMSSIEWWMNGEASKEGRECNAINMGDNKLWRKNYEQFQQEETYK